MGLIGWVKTWPRIEPRGHTPDGDGQAKMPSPPRVKRKIVNGRQVLREACGSVKVDVSYDLDYLSRSSMLSWQKDIQRAIRIVELTGKPHITTVSEHRNITVEVRP